MNLTKTAPVQCSACSGKGWLSVYHDSTEECYKCGGVGTKVGKVRKTSEEMITELSDKYKDPVDVEMLFSILEIYSKWSKL